MRPTLPRITHIWWAQGLEATTWGGRADREQVSLVDFQPTWMAMTTRIACPCR
jgi:hypothetical protein